MKLFVPEEFVSALTQLLHSASRMMTSISGKLTSEKEFIDNKTHISDEEINRGPALLTLEFENRERRAKVESVELEARELRAQADKAEALIRQRSAQIRQSNINRSTHKPKQPVNGQQSTNGQARPQPAAPERRDSVEGGSGGKTLTHSLGDKLKPVTPS